MPEIRDKTNQFPKLTRKMKRQQRTNYQIFYNG